MTSIPLQLLNYSKPNVYPTSTSPAWQFTPSGYIAADPLSNGVGYWIQFGAAQDITYSHLGIFSIDMPVHTGWNIVGSITQKIHTSQVQPINTNIESSFFEYNNGYAVADSITPGKGYWIKVSQAGTLRINIPLPVNPPTGVEPLPPILRDPPNGSTVEWEFVRLSWYPSSSATSYHLTVRTHDTSYNFENHTDTSQIIGPLKETKNQRIYSWRVRSTNMYGTSDWSAVWNFTYRPPDSAEPTVESFESLDKLTIIDSDGNQQNLFIVNDKRVLSHNLLMSAIMPPEPPAGIPSIRFESGKLIESISSKKKPKKIPIKLRNVSLPITISWKIKPENGVRYWLTLPGRIDRINLSSSGSIVVNNLKDSIINLEGIASMPSSPIGKNGIINNGNEQFHIPTSYALYQNYPNPFNSTTIIKYQLPENGHISLKVYDVLGREVATLVSAVKEAGYHQVEFDTSRISSGVYFYKIVAGNWTSVKKLLLAR